MGVGGGGLQNFRVNQKMAMLNVFWLLYSNVPFSNLRLGYDKFHYAFYALHDVNVPCRKLNLGNISNAVSLRTHVELKKRLWCRTGVRGLEP